MLEFIVLVLKVALSWVVLALLGAFAWSAFLASSGNRDRYTLTRRPKTLDGKVVRIRWRP